MPTETPTPELSSADSTTQSLQSESTAVSASEMDLSPTDPITPSLQPESTATSSQEPNLTPENPTPLPLNSTTTPELNLTPEHHSTPPTIQTPNPPPINATTNTFLPLQLELAAVQEQLKTLNRLSQVVNSELGLNVTDPSSSSSPSPKPTPPSQKVSSLLPPSALSTLSSSLTYTLSPSNTHPTINSNTKSTTHTTNKEPDPSAESFIRSFATHQQGGKLLSCNDPWFQKTLAEFRARQRQGEKQREGGENENESVSVMGRERVRVRVREWEVESEKGVGSSVGGESGSRIGSREENGTGIGVRGWLGRRWREFGTGEGSGR